MYKAIIIAAVLGLASASPKLEVHYHQGPDVKQCEPTPDPNVFPPAAVNLSLTPILEIFEGSSHQGGVMAGGSGVTVDIGIIVITLQLTFNLQVPTLDIDAKGVMSTGYLDSRPLTSLPVGNFTANGDDGMARLRNVVIRGNAQLFINIIGDRVQIRTLNVIELTFSDICLNLGPGFRIGGAPVDWADFCATFKSKFDAEWRNAQLREQAVEKIRGAANVIVGRYTLSELIDLIGGGGGEPCLQ